MWAITKGIANCNNNNNYQVDVERERETGVTVWTNESIMTHTSVESFEYGSQIHSLYFSNNSDLM